MLLQIVDYEGDRTLKAFEKFLNDGGKTAAPADDGVSNIIWL